MISFLTLWISNKFLISLLQRRAMFLVVVKNHRLETDYQKFSFTILKQKGNP